MTVRLNTVEKISRVLCDAVPVSKVPATTMSEPDELYTLRAQYWMGHYQMAIDEAKSLGRRPMSAELKAEKEEFLNRAYLALGQIDQLSGGTPGMQGPLLKIASSFYKTLICYFNFAFLQLLTPLNSRHSTKQRLGTPLRKSQP